MEKTGKKKKTIETPFELRTRKFRNATMADNYLKKLRLKDLKRECIARGMPFEEVSKGYIPQLQSFFIKNFNEDIKKERIHDYDMWLNNYLISHGKEPVHPMLQLGSTLEIDQETGEQILRTKKMKGFVKERKKVEKNDFGVRVGTAKAYVGYCVQRGLALDATLKRVQARFEKGTNEKSIKIWYKRFLQAKPA